LKILNILLNHTKINPTKKKINPSKKIIKVKLKFSNLKINILYISELKIPSLFNDKRIIKRIIEFIQLFLFIIFIKIEDKNEMKIPMNEPSEIQIK